MNLRCGSLTDSCLWSCRGWVLLGGLGVVVLGCGASFVVVMTSVRTVVVRSSSFLFESTLAGMGASPLGGSPTLQNDVVQRQAVTPVTKVYNFISNPESLVSFFSSLWITAMTENQIFTTANYITHRRNISTRIQFYNEAWKKSDVVFLKKSLVLVRFKPSSSCIVAGCANQYAMPHSHISFLSFCYFPNNFQSSN